MVSKAKRAAYKEALGDGALYQAWEFWTQEEWIVDWLREEAKRRGCTVKEIDNVDAQIAIAGAVLESPMFTIRNWYHTVTKTKQVVLIDPFKGQLILDIAIESQRKRGYAQRVVEIKPRQVGWTAWNLARCQWHAMQANNQVAFFIPDKEVVDQLNARFGDIYNNLGWMAPMRRIENRQQIVFANPSAKLRDEIKGLDSAITFAVPGGMRGRTPNVAILSEFAHWADSGFDPSSVLEALLSGMSAGEESCVVIDTTPNGYEDDYWPMVQEAIENNPRWVATWERAKIPTREEIINGILGEPDAPEEGWVPAFVAWFWHEQYTTKDESPAGQIPRMTAKQKQNIEATLGKKPEFGGDEELELQRKFGVSLAQLQWRRWKITNDIQGYDPRQKLLTFRQEFASTWRSPFVDFGNTAFDPLGMDVITRMAAPPTARGMLERDEGGTTVKWKINQRWLSDWEEMRFWAPSDPNEQYVIGVDLGWSFENMEADQTYAHVLRRRDRKQVAVYEARAPMHLVRRALTNLYFYYNRAYMGVETKGPGKNLVHELYFQCGVTNQYKWKRIDRADVKDSEYLGWETSENTRPIMDGQLMESIAHRDPNGEPAPSLILRDQKTIDQLLTVKRYPDGKIKSPSGHDDAVDGLGIALAINADYLHLYAPPRPQEQQRELDELFRTFQRKGLITSKGDVYAPSLADL